VTITILANGQSRETIDIDKIKTIKIGCNAIVRDYEVDHLICVDRRMAIEATELGHNSIYTRNDWVSSFKRIKTVPSLPYEDNNRWDEPFNWGSGPYAVLLGCKLDNKLDLIGFDLHSSNKKINNIYKGTRNYNNEDHRAIDPRYWILQIGKLMEIYSNVTFTIHQPIEWILPDKWNHPNVSLDNSTFF